MVCSQSRAVSVYEELQALLLQNLRVQPALGRCRERLDATAEGGSTRTRRGAAPAAREEEHRRPKALEEEETRRQQQTMRAGRKVTRTCPDRSRERHRQRGAGTTGRAGRHVQVNVLSSESW